LRHLLFVVQFVASLLYDVADVQFTLYIGVVESRNGLELFCSPCGNKVKMM